MEISKSTPYVRYRENISSTLHKGTIHIESEYLDRERKTTIESIEGQTWQNMVNGENKEEDILPRLGLKIEGNEDVLDTVEQHMPIDTIIGDAEPVANEDGTYTYEISTMEGSYAKTLDGENNFSLTSDGLVGDMYIKYNAQGEEVNGNIVMNGQSSYTIEDSKNGAIKSAILKGQTLVNIYKITSSMPYTYKAGSTPQRKMARNLLANKTYLILLDFSTVDKGSKDMINFFPASIFVDGTSKQESSFTINKNGRFIYKYTPSKDVKDYALVIGQNNFIDNNPTVILESAMIIEYQDGMENWNIPYFEGMQSVENPTIITSNSPVQFGKGGRL